MKSNLRRSAIEGVCRYCGCTELRPCFIPAQLVLSAMGEEPDPHDERKFPCSWLLPDVCTAPLCVEKAYREAAERVEALIFAEIARVA